MGELGADHLRLRSYGLASLNLEIFLAGYRDICGSFPKVGLKWVFNRKLNVLKSDLKMGFDCGF